MEMSEWAERAPTEPMARSVGGADWLVRIRMRLDDWTPRVVWARWAALGLQLTFYMYGQCFILIGCAFGLLLFLAKLIPTIIV